LRRQKEIRMSAFNSVSLFRAAIAAMLVGLMGAVIAISPAVADGLNGPNATVKFRDLDVSTPQGAAALYARIRAAAYDVCSEFDSHDNISALLQRDKCVEDVTSSAVTKLNSSALSAVYNAKTGKEIAQECAAADSRNDPRT
jgi:UrcA family protein